MVEGKDKEKEDWNKYRSDTKVCVYVHIYSNVATIATNDSTYLHLFHRLNHASFAPRSLPK